MSDPLDKATQNNLGQPIGESLPDWTPPPTPSRCVLEGRFVVVKRLDAEAHTKDLFAAKVQDPEGRNWTYLPYGPFSEFDDYQRWIESVSGADDPLFFAVIPKASGKAAGLASYLRIQPQSGSIEVGHIHFSNGLQGTPAATEAIFLMMRHAFELGYRRYEWKCDALNARSCAAAERLGLSFEGIFRQATVYKERNRDTAWFATLDSEWPELCEAFECWLSPENFDSHGQQLQSLGKLTRPLLNRRFKDSPTRTSPS